MKKQTFSRLTIMSLLVTLVVLPLTSSRLVRPSVSLHTTQPMPPRVSEAYGNLSLSFDVNQGQTDPQVQFLSRGSGYSLFLTPTEGDSIAEFGFRIAE